MTIIGKVVLRFNRSVKNSRSRLGCIRNVAATGPTVIHSKAETVLTSSSMRSAENAVGLLKSDVTVSQTCISSNDNVLSSADSPEIVQAVIAVSNSVEAVKLPVSLVLRRPDLSTSETTDTDSVKLRAVSNGVGKKRNIFLNDDLRQADSSPVVTVSTSRVPLSDAKQEQTRDDFVSSDKCRQRSVRKKSLKSSPDSVKLPEPMAEDFLDRLYGSTCPSSADTVSTLLSESVELRILVTHVVDMRHFWGQVINDGECFDKVQRMHLTMQDTSKKGMNLPRVTSRGIKKAGALYGDEEELFRVYIREMGETWSKVLYIDYGNETSVLTCGLRVLPDDVWNIPVAATPFRYEGDLSGCDIRGLINTKIKATASPRLRQSRYVFLLNNIVV